LNPLPTAASAVCQSDSIVAAVTEAFETAASRVTQPVSLVIVFFSCPEASTMSDVLAEKLAKLAPNATVIGCSAESVLGVRTEIEQQMAASVMVIAGLQAAPKPFNVEYQPTADGPSLFGLPDALLEESIPGSGLLLLADPFSFPIDLMTDRIAQESPGLPILGGYASGVAGPYECGLIMNNEGSLLGAVGILLPPEIQIQPLVSQGCRPIGSPMTVTKVDEGTILELSGKPALPQLRSLYEESSTSDQELMLKSLLIGLAVYDVDGEQMPNDFLVRQCLGVDDDVDGIVLPEPARVGQSVQFHVRDSETAHADLQVACKRVESKYGQPLATLLFTCNGRGSRMFSEPHHDAKVLDHYFPNAPLAGFFAAGEFGPVGSKSFAHGFTATAAVLYVANKPE
jgi:small ligand-binding sensory domain FIST